MTILLNGAATGFTFPVFNGSSFDPFVISTGFVAGVNTLDFLVDNFGGGPTGLRVELSGTADVAAVPEPATLSSADVAGLMGLGIAWRRRRRTAA